MTSFKERIEQIVRDSTLRWLHQVCFVPHFKYEGVADREYWAWKTKDFANGTWQGGLAGFLDSLSLFDFNHLEIQKIISTVIKGTKKIQRSNGSFEEAYPLESSFAVTGLVLFYLSYAYLKHSELFPDESTRELISVGQKAAKFIQETPETHGIISNHLFTSYLALVMFRKVEGKTTLDENLINSLKKLQRTGGWFYEYNGADPGYQTLLNHYIFSAQEVMGPILNDCLKKSLKFVDNFFMPDGTFAGEIGARGTSILYPSGIIDTSQWENSILHIKQYLSNESHLNPLYVDQGNFVPVYCSWASMYFFFKTKNNDHLHTHPSHTEKEIGIHKIGDSGLLKFQSKQTVGIVNTKTGAIRMNKLINEKWVDASVVSLERDNFEQSQVGKVKNLTYDQCTIEIEILFSAPKERYNNTFSATALRLISYTIFYCPPLQRLIKKILAYSVMGQNKPPTGDSMQIRIHIQNGKIEISGESAKIRKFGFFQHMASANTFQRRALE